MGTIHLIRHGQASFASDDYDLLSPLGHDQSRRLGEAWGAADWGLFNAVSGTMLRQSQTAGDAIEACGVETVLELDTGWNEFDHHGLVQARDTGNAPMDSRQFQSVLNLALADWMSGGEGFSETYREFCDRVRTSFEKAVGAAGPGEKVAIFTSAGPIAWLTSVLLAGDDSLFQRLNDVVVNASVTTVLAGSTGPRLLTFNEHAHLAREVVSFR